MALVGCDYCYQSINDAYLKRTGLERRSIEGHPVAEVLGQAVFDEIIKSQLDRCFAGEQITYAEWFDFADEGRRYMSVTYSPCRDTQSAIIGAVVIAHDITERRQAEEAQRENEEKFRLFTDNAAEILYVFNLESGHLDFVSPAIERMTGYTVEEAMTHSLDRVMTPESYAYIGPKQIERSQLFLSGASGPHVYSDELVHQRKDGSTYLSELVVRYMTNKQGQPIIVGVLNDITERKQAEQEIRRLNATLEQQVQERTTQLAAAVADLERAAKVKDEFMAAVSHELRTPLTGVLTMTEVLEMQSNGPLNERQARYVQSIHQSGERLLALVNSILRYTSLAAGNVKLQQESCVLAELCAIAVRAVRGRAEQKGQTVEFSGEPARLAIVSDAQGIIQVLQQLLDNAVKFTPAGGQIGLEVRGDAGGESVHLVMWDTGIGIAPEQQATIFRPFVQGDSSLARHYEGVGLGLAYVQRMVDLLGGTITLESALGKGSRFTITLPSGKVRG